MRLPILISTAVLTAAIIATGSFTLVQHTKSATAATGTGTVTGRVVWNSPFVVPYGSTAPGAPGVEYPDEVPPENEIEPTPDTGLQIPSSPDGGITRPGVPVRPLPRPRLIPAGAVLVAVQGTDLSTRSDDRGYFRLENVPAGQFLTVAAGPAGGITGAVAMRPNVQVRENATTSLGTLFLGQPYSYGYPIPYPMTPGAAEGETDQAESEP